jgi:F0F1-type ATP synthase assembly protein I
VADKDSIWTMAARYSGMAFAVPAGVVAGYLIGGFADSRLGTHHWYIAGVILGAIGGLIQIVRGLSGGSNDAG